MRKGILTTVLLMAALSVAAQEFVLIESGPNRNHGPFKYEDGSIIRIGEKVYTLRMVNRPKTAIEQRAEDIVIPSLQFREAALVDVVAFLRDASQAADPLKRGISVVLRMRERDPEKERPLPTLSLNLRQVSVKDAIRYVAEVSGLRVRYDDAAIVIMD